MARMGERRRPHLGSRITMLLACTIGLAACDVPKSMHVRTGVDPKYEDDDVRFRTTYFFRVFDACYAATPRTPSTFRTDTVFGGKQEDQPLTLRFDSLYRFRMTGKANSLFNKIHFESGSLHKSQIDPFGNSVRFDQTNNNFRIVTRQETEEKARRDERYQEIERLIQLKAKTGTGVSGFNENVDKLINQFLVTLAPPLGGGAPAPLASARQHVKDAEQVSREAQELLSSAASAQRAAAAVKPAIDGLKKLSASKRTAGADSARDGIDPATDLSQVQNQLSVSQGELGKVIGALTVADTVERRAADNANKLASQHHAALNALATAISTRKANMAAALPGPSGTPMPADKIVRATADSVANVAALGAATKTSLALSQAIRDLRIAVDSIATSTEEANKVRTGDAKRALAFVQSAADAASRYENAASQLAKAAADADSKLAQAYSDQAITTRIDTAADAIRAAAETAARDIDIVTTQSPTKGALVETKDKAGAVVMAGDAYAMALALAAKTYERALGLDAKPDVGGTAAVPEVAAAVANISSAVNQGAFFSAEATDLATKSTAAARKVTAITQVFTKQLVDDLASAAKEVDWPKKQLAVVSAEAGALSDKLRDLASSSESDARRARSLSDGAARNLAVGGGGTATSDGSAGSSSSACPPGTAGRRGFQILGPEGWRTFDQDERLIMAMSSSAKPLIGVLQEVSSRTLAPKLNRSDQLLPLVTERLRLSEADRMVESLRRSPRDTAADTVRDVLNAFDPGGSRTLSNQGSAP